MGGGVYKAYMEQCQAKPTVCMIMYVKTVVKQKKMTNSGTTSIATSIIFTGTHQLGSFSNCR